jgi:hypothetical protein
VSTSHRDASSRDASRRDASASSRDAPSSRSRAGASSRPGARRARRDWPGLLLRPHVLIGALALVAAVPYLVGSFGGSQSVDSTLPSLGTRAPLVQREVEMPLVLATPGGGVRTVVEVVRSEDHDGARWTAALAALRDVLVAEGVWPISVQAPRVSTFETNRRRVAVIDVAVPGRVAVSVADEWAALRSMVETMRPAGADDVRVIVNGAPAATLWGEVALP